MLTHLLMLAIGLVLLFVILKSMVHVALMARHDLDIIARLTRRTVHALIGLRLRNSRGYEDSQRVLHWFFGTFILSLIGIYFFGAMTAFALLYWGTWSVPSWYQAFIAAGSGLNTLGFATPPTPAGQWLAIPEGALGLGIVVFLFTFIPGFQSVIRSRDDQTAWLYARLSDLTSGASLLEWSTRSKNPDGIDEIWEMWESWFRLLADTHCSSPMLAIVPSVQTGQSWIIAAAVVLDAASLSVSTVDSGNSQAAMVCVRTGTRAITLIADALSMNTKKDVGARSDISRKEFDRLCSRLSAIGLTLKSDREASWSEFVSLRSLYSGAISYVARQMFVPQLFED